MEDNDMKIEILTSMDDMKRNCQKSRGAQRIFDACVDVLDCEENVTLDTHPEYPPLSFAEPAKECLAFDLHWKDTVQNRQDFKEFAEALQYGDVRINGNPIIEPKMVYEADADLFRPSNREMEQTRQELESIIEKAKLPFSVDFADEIPFVEEDSHRFLLSQPVHVDIDTDTAPELKQSYIVLPVKDFNIQRISQAVTDDYFRVGSMTRANQYIFSQFQPSHDVDDFKPFYQAFENIHQNVCELASVLQDYTHQKYQECFCEGLGKDAALRMASRSIATATRNGEAAGISEAKLKKLVTESFQHATKEQGTAR